MPQAAVVSFAFPLALLFLLASQCISAFTSTFHLSPTTDIMNVDQVYITHPTNAQEASRFQAEQVPVALGFPTATGHLTPPATAPAADSKSSFASSTHVAIPHTPAATPAATTLITAGAAAAPPTGVSGIVPTLQ